MVTACFKEKNTFIKCLVFLVSVLIMILVALAMILINRKTVDNHVCKSESCINLSAQVIRYADRSANPCEDFHTFTCGSFIKSGRVFPPPSPEQEIRSMIKEMVQFTDSNAFKMLKTFYMACSNTDAINFNNDESIINLFYGAGDWPVLRGSGWDGTFFDWTNVAINNRRLGLKFDWFFDFSVYEDVNDTGYNIFKIDIPALSPLRESEILPRQKLFTKIAIALGAPQRLAHYETGRTIDFENSLRMLAEEHRKKRTHPNLLSPPKMTINQVETLWPNIHWLQLINSITGLNLVGSDYVIFDEVLEYVKALNKLIYGTPKRIVADYMMWKIVEEWWPYLSSSVREEFEDYYEKQYNRTPEVDRQKFCINESRKQFPLIAESEYIRRTVTQKKREVVMDMLFGIRDKFKELVKRATWINREARDRALSKLRNLDFDVGGPRQLFDEFGFTEDLGLYRFRFRSPNVTEMFAERNVRFYDNYFSVVNTVVSNRTQRFYEKVVNISRFTIINGNTLVIPAAVLRDVFYNPQLPNYFNYATLGRTVAHEIFEFVFERSNRSIINEENINYDALYTADAFESVVKCLIKESSYIHIPELKRPEKMRRLLADLVAPEVAYEAYKDWTFNYPQEFKLPALEYSPLELFWIHTSKLSCKKIYSRYDRDYSRFKIIGPLRNSRNFATDYNCTEGSKMVARKQCRIL